MGKVEIVSLGTGNHLTAVYDGVSSSSCVILVDGFPVLLIGCGIGTIRGCNHYLQQIPDTILLLNDTPSQCAELGALVAGETSRGRQLKVYAQDSICHFAADQLRREMKDEAFAMKVKPDLVSLVRLSLTSDLIPLTEDLSVLMHPNYYRKEHSVIAVAVVLFYKDLPILSITGPCSFDTSLLVKLCNAPFVLVWAIPNSQIAAMSVNEGISDSHPSGDVGGGDDGWSELDRSSGQVGATSGQSSHFLHSVRPASVSEVSLFADKVNNSRPHEERVVFLLTGYGGPNDSPMIAGNVNPVQVGVPTVVLAGDVVNSQYGPLEIPLPHLRKAGSRASAGALGTGLGNGSPVPGVKAQAQQQLLNTSNRSPSPQQQQHQHSQKAQASGYLAGTSSSGVVKAWGEDKQNMAAASSTKKGTKRSTTTAGGSNNKSLSSADPRFPTTYQPDQSSLLRQQLNTSTNPGGNSKPTKSQHHVDPQSQQNQQQQYPSSYEEAGLVSGVSAHNTSVGSASAAAALDRSNNRRVFIFNNEDKGVPGKLVMLNQFRRLDQLHQRASELTKLKPIKDLVFPDGRTVVSLEEIPDMSELIVLRRGGVHYDNQDLPRLMRSNRKR